MAIQAKRIRERRRALGLSQEALAEQIGSTQGQISKIEAGESIPTSDVLVALAQTLQVSADWLLGLSNAMECITDSADLTSAEQEAISAWRNGEHFKAIKTIVLNE